MTEPRFFCSELSRSEQEPLGATASRVDHWPLVEYRGLWGPNAFRSSGLSDQVKRSLREQVRARPRTRLLFVRRPDRRGWPALRAYAATSVVGEESLRCHSFEDYEELRTLDLVGSGEAIGHPLLLVCTHGKHDQCCALHGRPLFEALAEQVEEEWVWQTTHIGGDRFAGNVVCLPHGLYYGRVERGGAITLLEEHLADRIDLDHYRGRSVHTFAEQAAERAVREDTAARGIDSVRLVRHDGERIAFSVDGAVHERIVVEERGEPRRLTCNAQEERRPPRYRVSAA